MPETVRRGFVPTDAREFGADALLVLRQAQQDILYLINRGYGLERAVTFVGDRFQLSARQRAALTRATAREEDVRARKSREITEFPEGITFRIDGFNLIIPLEIALSGSMLLLCMDGAVRDLAGLHGSYRLIDKTDLAIRLIGESLRKLKAARAEFYLDSPVSNAGRLKQRISELLSGFPFETEVTLVKNADSVLWDKEAVVTGDSAILDRCKSWVNLTRRILAENMPEVPPVDLSRPG